MSDPAFDIDRHLKAPLAELNGASPCAPDWFVRALDQRPEQGFVTVQGARIETLSWGERGRPGLLFIHGGRAHAHWWDHIAPFFAPSFRVTALSLSGGGSSSWRERYSVRQFAAEMVAVARASGLYDVGAPIFVAHSFGSRPLLAACADAASAPRAAVIVDSAVSAPEGRAFQPALARPSSVFATLEAGLSRFRLLPAQRCDNLFILDHIARLSLKPAETGTGWTWRFDPLMQSKMMEDGFTAEAALRHALCPLSFIYGGRSEIVKSDNLAYTRSIAPPSSRFICLEAAAHHLFLDHPLDFVRHLEAELRHLGSL